MWAISVDGTGDVTDSHVRWKYKRGVPRRSSPLLVDGRIYMISDDGVASCVDFKTGQEIWKGRVGGNHSASLLYADELIYFFSEEGATTLIRAQGGFEVVRVNPLDDGFMASPAVAGNALYLRSKTHLYRIQE